MCGITFSVCTIQHSVRYYVFGLRNTAQCAVIQHSVLYYVFGLQNTAQRAVLLFSVCTIQHSVRYYVFRHTTAQCAVLCLGPGVPRQAGHGPLPAPKDPERSPFWAGLLARVGPTTAGRKGGGKRGGGPGTSRSGLDLGIRGTGVSWQAERVTGRLVADDVVSCVCCVGMGPVAGRVVLPRSARQVAPYPARPSCASPSPLPPPVQGQWEGRQRQGSGFAPGAISARRSQMCAQREGSPRSVW